jgi:hypothetical protein
MILLAGLAIRLADHQGSLTGKDQAGSEAMSPQQRLGLLPGNEVSLRASVISVEDDDMLWELEYTLDESRTFLVGHLSASSLDEDRRRHEEDLEALREGGDVSFRCFHEGEDRPCDRDETMAAIARELAAWPDPDDLLCLGGSGASYTCRDAGGPSVDFERGLTPDIIVWWGFPDDTALVTLTSGGSTTWQSPVFGVAAFERPWACYPCDYELAAFDDAGATIDVERGTWLRTFEEGEGAEPVTVPAARHPAGSRHGLQNR